MHPPGLGGARCGRCWKSWEGVTPDSREELGPLVFFGLLVYLLPSQLKVGVLRVWVAWLDLASAKRGVISIVGFCPRSWGVELGLVPLRQIGHTNAVRFKC